jgi:hypothetical protein
MNSISIFFSNLTLGKKLLLLVTPLISLLAPMKLIILGLVIIIFIDLLTGIRKSLHKGGISFNPFKAAFRKSIKSYLFRKTWKKSYEYGMGIIVLFVFEMFIFGLTPITIMDKTFTITELGVLIPSAIEVWSIFENLEAVSGRNILKRLVKLLPKSIRDLLKPINKDE